MNDLKHALLQRLERLGKEQNTKIGLFDIAPLLGGFIEALEGTLKDDECLIYEGLKNVIIHIKHLKEFNLSEKVESLIAADTAGCIQELDEVLKHCDASANTILDAADKLQEFINQMEDGDRKNEMMMTVSQIFQASDFQDLSGQRLRKVSNFMVGLQEGITALAPQPEKDNSPQSLLNGPQASGNAPSQEDIDRLFDSL